MKTKNFTYPLLFSLLFSCTACVNSTEDNKATNSNPIVEEVNLIITLGATQSITCNDKTTFNVIPSTIEPAVTFIQDVESGDVTILVDKQSKGTIKIENCTKI
ncbi:hypothetical protein JHD49_06405 [Sulfurimonas sp. SAG-AH-194-C21]|nr:hypothetical protein [Sulfurimonas sp. SAG-AH-194-C21]MDF1883568.1 hypothetical protein [Sulfurimonas sp. SAG-AH-194-C21]